VSNRLAATLSAVRRSVSPTPAFIPRGSRDVRGKYGSEGDYVMTPAAGAGRLNTSKVDHSTDA